MPHSRRRPHLRRCYTHDRSRTRDVGGPHAEGRDSSVRTGRGPVAGMEGHGTPRGLPRRDHRGVHRGVTDRALVPQQDHQWVAANPGQIPGAGRVRGLSGHQRHPRAEGLDPRRPDRTRGCGHPRHRGRDRHQGRGRAARRRGRLARQRQHHSRPDPQAPRVRPRRDSGLRAHRRLRRRRHRHRPQQAGPGEGDLRRRGPGRVRGRRHRAQGPAKGFVIGEDITGAGQPRRG